MTRIYQNPRFTRTSNISIAILFVVILFGVWELIHAFAGGTPDTTGLLFGAAFVGGGLYGLKSTWEEHRDLVVAVEVNFEAGTVGITLWRPFRQVRIERGLGDLTGWRYWVKVGKRAVRTHYLLVRATDYPRPLSIELQRGDTVSEGLRRLAPEAIADMEANTGTMFTAATEAKRSD